MHWFVVDLLHDEQKLLRRSLERLKIRRTFHEGPAETFGDQRCIPLEDDEDYHLHHWSYLWHQDRWKSVRQFSAENHRMYWQYSTYHVVAWSRCTDPQTTKELAGTYRFYAGIIRHNSHEHPLTSSLLACIHQASESSPSWPTASLHAIMQAPFQKAFIRKVTSRRLLPLNEHSTLTPLLKPQPQPHRPATSTTPLIPYYHLPEGAGSIYTFPFQFSTGTALERLWHGRTNFQHTVHAIGTHGCKFCAGVYIRLNGKECFAAHLKAYIHLERWEKGESAWIPTAEQGERLRTMVAAELREYLALQGCDLGHVDRGRSFVVCPDAVYQGKRSTGFYLCQGLRDVFGDLRDTGMAAHGYVVDHLHARRQLLARGPETSKRGYSVEHPSEEYGFTDTDGSSPDGWRYFEEVVFGGKEAGPESYR